MTGHELEESVSALCEGAGRPFTSWTRFHKYPIFGFRMKKEGVGRISNKNKSLSIFVAAIVALYCLYVAMSVGL